MHGLLLQERERFAAGDAGGPDVFDRLALLIYGIGLGDHWQSLPPRRDGVIRGTDFLLSSSEVNDAADDDARRIALFDSSLSPYRLNRDGIVWLGDTPTGLALRTFPYKNYLGPPFGYYLRSGRDGRYTRVVVNPHANCYSRCKWCARTYDGHARPNRIATNTTSGLTLDERALRQLPLSVTPVDDLVRSLIEDPAVVNPDDGTLSHLTEFAVLSGDFPPNESAVAYFVELLRRVKTLGFGGRFYYAGHQIEQRADMERVAETGLATRFVYTIEHFTRRLELMPVKGKRSLDDIAKILEVAGAVFGRANIYYYLIIGIDSIVELRRNLERFKGLATPQPFVLTPYNFIHTEIYREDSQIGRLRLVLQARSLFLQLFGRPIPGGSNRSLFPLTQD